LDKLIIAQGELLITDDLNVHLDDSNDIYSRKLIETLQDHGLQQHVIGSTHVRGHTLDGVITRENSVILSSIPSIFDPNLSGINGKSRCDHFAIMTKLCIAKPPNIRSTVAFRKFRAIDLNDLSNHLLKFVPLQNPEGTLDELVQAYYTEISSIINKHTPLQSKSIILRPNTDWYSDELRSAKTERRKAEREMQKYS
jgi:hypothetical protein